LYQPAAADDDDAVVMAVAHHLLTNHPVQYIIASHWHTGLVNLLFTSEFHFTHPSHLDGDD